MLQLFGLPIPALDACAVRVPVALPAAIGKKPAVAGAESSDDEPILSETGLTNPYVAKVVETFIDSMQTTGRNIGKCTRGLMQVYMLSVV